MLYPFGRLSFKNVKSNSGFPRVLIVGNYKPDGSPSQTGFSKWLTDRMPQEGFDIQFTSATPRLGIRPGRFAKWRGYIDRYVLFPPQLRRLSKEVDIVHITDQSNSMYGRHSTKSWGVTVHDLLAQRAALNEFPGWSIGPTGRVYQRWIRKSLLGARWIGCSSAATRDDFRKMINPDPKVSYLTVDGPYDDYRRLSIADSTKALEEVGLGRLLNQPFILHLGGNQSYKNRPGYIKIAAELQKGGPCKDHLFVASGRPFDAVMNAAVQQYPLGDALVKVERPALNVVMALYSTADALVFPSVAEGFGLPVLEGMLSGCPVFTSDRAPMTEIGGSAARYFDPMDAKQAAGVISSEWGERAAMAEAGYVQAEAYSADASAAQFGEWYHKILGSSLN